MKPVRNISIGDITKKTPNLYNFQRASDKDYRNAEQAVYEFDKHIGTGFVPKTYTYNAQNASYTIQEWLTEREHGVWSVPDDMEAFDFMTGNLDRFWDRNLFKSDGKFYAIDNEVAFPNPVLSVSRYIFKMRGLGRTPLDQLQLSDGMKEKINNIKTEELYPLLSPYLKNPEHIDEMVTRVNYLKAVVNGDELSAQDIIDQDGKNAVLLYTRASSESDDITILNKLFAAIYRDADANGGALSKETIALLGREDAMDYLDKVAGYDANKVIFVNEISVFTKLMKEIVAAKQIETQSPTLVREKVREFKLKYEELKGIIKK
jgi:hypothetical protein